MIETDLPQPYYFISFLLGLWQFAGRFGDQAIQKAAVCIIQMVRYLSGKVFKVIIGFGNKGFYDAAEKKLGWQTVC